ncbi:zinc finger protein ZPR1 [Procambarus clarkii]|uniref:zinc finger protein ZPR1 n=1 Tax=Procambarus clarkii TaxID=6728 RepID=UPI001E6750BF|nr:zinc finger protein ZPR1-like [Procambarus clarkii]XP_045605261.1 zinc finger protein ZPR1-like [Procambarus clarkii]XP_045605262.1 zinc finger protein ZPR1-like [Procambarus clarkii]
MGEEVQPIYVDLASESDDPHVTIVDSLCMSCEKMGTTRLLMTRIPHYKEVILTSFECEHCGNKNTGFQLGQVQDQGVRYELCVENEMDLSRQIVRSNHATVSVPEVQLEIPGNLEKGEVTTIEGILRRTVEELSQDQSARRMEQREVADQIDDFIDKILELLTLDEPFTLIVDDPSGNSFVENLHAPHTDPQLKKKVYKRSPEQNAELGLEEEPVGNGLDSVSEEIEKKDESKEEVLVKKSDKKEDDPGNLKDEVLVFSTLCDRCSRPTSTNMKIMKIPYFKEVIIMAMHCEHCGHRTNEVKSGTGVSDLGKRISLKITDPCDLARDVLKSETCEVKIPDFDLHVGGGLIGGKFTTLEGLLINIRDDIEANPFLMGDAAGSNRKTLINKLVDDLQMVIDGNLKVTIILDDPAGNSYLQNIYAPDEDPEITVEEYERTFEQNEELGLNDMKTENYTDDSTCNDISELS